MISGRKTSQTEKDPGLEKGRPPPDEGGKPGRAAPRSWPSGAPNTMRVTWPMFDVNAASARHGPALLGGETKKTVPLTARRSLLTE